MDKIFEIKSLLPGFPSVTVYKDRVLFKTGLAYMKRENTIMADKINTVSTVGYSLQVILETNDGKKHKLPTLSMEKREELKNAILSIIK